MKKIILIFTFLLIAASGHSQDTFKSFYKTNKGDTEFAMSMPAFIIKWFVPEEDVQEVQPILDKISHFRIMVFERNGAQQGKLFNRFAGRNNYASIMKVKEDGEEIEFFFQKRKGIIRELVVKVQEEDEMVVLGLRTKITEEDFEEFLASNSDMIAMEH